MTETPLQLFTSESVTEGHPDKVCDRISDAVLDAILAQDPTARVAVETFATNGLVYVVGEVTTEAYVDVQGIVRQTVNEIGYTSSAVGFDGNSCGVAVSISAQSPEISHSVEASLEARTGQVADAYDQQGAGDQGLMFGYATDETPTLMPLPIFLSHQLAERLAQVRKEELVPGLRPDGKTQVTVGYRDGVAQAIHTVVVSTQHAEDVTQQWLTQAITEHVINPVLAAHVPSAVVCEPTILVNPSGSFTLGGPKGDAGLTGRKIIVDTYGGMARHGGGAFSGKDPSKVDRSASYAMRWVAKNIVAAGLARRCEVQVAYAIGVAHPIGVHIETFGTATVPEDKLLAAVRQVFDLRPAAIIDHLQLRRPIYKATSAYGHFGRELPEFTWEQTDKTEQLRAAAGL
ncbi:MAG: methionine adenosyltransferase [Buchananella hordeovulneris]|nr:methionine adenosyltransferase [Buchananella hordeovulneris]MDO5079664.1 methionine adenosyltransferase [Buchananella hordeovulneris]